MTEAYDILDGPPDSLPSPPGSPSLPPIVDINGNAVGEVKVPSPINLANSSAVTSPGAIYPPELNTTVVANGNQVKTNDVVGSSATSTAKPGKLTLRFGPNSAPLTTQNQPRTYSSVPSFPSQPTRSTSYNQHNTYNPPNSHNPQPSYSEAPVTPSTAYSQPATGHQYPTVGAQPANRGTYRYSNYNSDDYQRMKDTVRNYKAPSGAKLRIEVYTEKSFIVRGETSTYYTELKKLNGSWTSRPRHGTGTDPGWYFPNSRIDEVLKYVGGVNSGAIAAPPPSVPTQTVKWEVFRPNDGMKLKIKIGNGVFDYWVSSVSKDARGYIVISAQIVCTQDPKNVQNIVIINGQWQIYGYTQQHSIEALL